MGRKSVPSQCGIEGAGEGSQGHRGALSLSLSFPHLSDNSPPGYIHHALPPLPQLFHTPTLPYLSSLLLEHMWSLSPQELCSYSVLLLLPSQQTHSERNSHGLTMFLACSAKLAFCCGRNRQSPLSPSKTPYLQQHELQGVIGLLVHQFFCDLLRQRQTEGEKY